MKFFVSFILICSALAMARDLKSEYEWREFQIGNVVFVAFVADTDSKRETGLMFIERLEKNEGMLFVFDRESPKNFWMKNTLIPLSIGFFDRNAKLVDVQEMNPGSSLMDLNVPTYESKKPAMYALEMPSKWFELNKLKLGQELSVRDLRPLSSLSRLKRVPSVVKSPTNVETKVKSH